MGADMRGYFEEHCQRIAWIVTDLAEWLLFVGEDTGKEDVLAVWQDMNPDNKETPTISFGVIKIVPTRAVGCVFYRERTLNDSKAAKLVYSGWR